MPAESGQKNKSGDLAGQGGNGGNKQGNKNIIFKDRFSHITGAVSEQSLGQDINAQNASSRQIQQKPAGQPEKEPLRRPVKQPVANGYDQNEVGRYPEQI